MLRVRGRGRASALGGHREALERTHAPRDAPLLPLEVHAPGRVHRVRGEPPAGGRRRRLLGRLRGLRSVVRLHLRGGARGGDARTPTRGDAHARRRRRRGEGARARGGARGPPARGRRRTDERRERARRRARRREPPRVRARRRRVAGGARGGRVQAKRRRRATGKPTGHPPSAARDDGAAPPASDERRLQHDRPGERGGFRGSTRVPGEASAPSRPRGVPRRPGGPRGDDASGRSLRRRRLPRVGSGPREARSLGRPSRRRRVPRGPGRRVRRHRRGDETNINIVGAAPRARGLAASPPELEPALRRAVHARELARRVVRRGPRRTRRFRGGERRPGRRAR